jgi:uncharacterized protein involved in cysteine biosynthesis
VIRRVDPLSVLRVSLVFYVFVYVAGVLVGIACWLVASAAGIVDNVETLIGDLFALEDFHFVAWRILRAGALAGAAFVLLATVANLLGAIAYNVISRVVGGIEVTTVDDDAAPRSVV